jgi:hypothetical protein
LQIFTVPQLPMDGPKDLVLRFPDTWAVQVHNMAGYNRPAIDMKQIQAALRNPIGSTPPRDLAKGKKEVVIIFDDCARGMRWNAIAHAVLAELDDAGIRDDQIRFMCALGSHGVATRTPMIQKLGEDIVSRYRVYNHNAFSLDNVHLGKTRTWGVDIYANPEVMACDLRIALGAVTPHPINGFGGGSKCVLSGIVSYQTIVDHHLKSFKIVFDAMNEAAKTGAPSKVGLGIYDPEDRPAIDVDDEAAAMVGIDFLVNVVANGRGEASGIWAGDFRQVFVAALIVRVADHRRVHLGVAHVDEEGLLRRRVPLDEVDGLRHDVLLVHNRPHRQVKRHHRLGWLALLSLPDHGRWHAALLEQRPRSVARLIPRVLDAPPLVEALIVRQPALSVAQVPLAIQRGGIAGVGEQFGGGVFPRRHPSLPLSGQRNGVRPRASRISPGHDGGASWCALGLDVIVVEADSLARHLVDTRCGYHSAVYPKSSPAYVVHQDKDDVWRHFSAPP